MDERTTTFTYHPATGFLASIEDPLGRVVTIDSTDAAGRPTQETLPGSRVVGFGWDANGNLASLTPPGKPAHTFRYTPVDQESEYEPPAVGASPPWITETTWDGDRRLALVERPDATAIDLAYETPSGRLDAVTIPEGTIDLGYHPATGQLETLSAPGGGVLALGWNGFLLESQTWSGAVAGSVGFGYESPGMRLTEETVNGADPIGFAYDDDGLLTGAGALTLTPHPSHGLLQDTTLGVVTTAYGYSSFGELASDSASVSGSPVYVNTYTVRDKLGRIRQKVETIEGATTTWDFAYDPAGRLDTVDCTPSGGSPVRVADHAYDANGNRLCTNETAGACPAQAVYDEQDRLVADEAGRSYAYTEAGELERVTEGSSHTLYHTDALGNLRRVCLASSDPDTCTCGTGIEYVIDALGRRIGKKVNATLQKGYLWSDALRVVAELNGSGAVVSRFVYGTRVNVPEYMVKGGSTYRILTDHLGSVRLVVNAATGAVAQRIDYDAWGVPTFVTGAADFQPFGFAGGLYDPDTGLVRFGARDYDARTGRWTSKDRKRFRGGDANLYSYVIGDPINFIDPTGHIKFKPGVSDSGLVPRMRGEFPLVDSVAINLDLPEPTVTSTTDSDSKRVPNSKHASGEACDLRGNELSDEAQDDLAAALGLALGDDYDVVSEHFPDNPALDHIHIEYDPRPGKPTNVFRRSR